MTKMYQVSTLQALALGYSKSVITVGELLKHGDTGLGTFEDVNGEMIVLEGHCYQANENGNVTEAENSAGVPFSSVTLLKDGKRSELGENRSIDDLKTVLTQKIEENFGLNSMHIVRIDGSFRKVSARSAWPAQIASVRRNIWVSTEGVARAVISSGDTAGSSGWKAAILATSDWRTAVSVPLVKIR